MNSPFLDAAGWNAEVTKMISVRPRSVILSMQSIDCCSCDGGTCEQCQSQRKLTRMRFSRAELFYSPSCSDCWWLSSEKI